MNIPAAQWFHMITEELHEVILAAGKPRTHVQFAWDCIRVCKITDADLIRRMLDYAHQRDQSTNEGKP